MFIKRGSDNTTQRWYRFPYLLANTNGTGPVFWKTRDISGDVPLPKSDIPDVFGVTYKFGDLISLGSNKYLDGVHIELTITSHTLEVHMPDGDWDIFEHWLSDSFCLDIK